MLQAVGGPFRNAGPSPLAYPKTGQISQVRPPTPKPLYRVGKLLFLSFATTDFFQGPVTVGGF